MVTEESMKRSEWWVGKMTFATAFWINWNCPDCSFPSQKKSINQDTRWWEGLLGLAQVGEKLYGLAKYRMKICQVFYPYVMIWKLSGFSLGKRPFLVILGVILQKSLWQLCSSVALCSSSPHSCRCVAELFLHLVGCRWVPTYFFVNPRSRLSLGTCSNAPACLSCKTVVSMYHVSYKRGMFYLVPCVVMLSGHCNHHCQCSWCPRLPHVLLCGEGCWGLGARFWNPLVADARACRRGYLVKPSWMPCSPDVSLHASCDGSQWKNTSLRLAFGL